MPDVESPSRAAAAALGRLAEPRDVGNVAAFLASPLAGYVSGATVAAHGAGQRVQVDPVHHLQGILGVDAGPFPSRPTPHGGRRWYAWAGGVAALLIVAG